MGVVWSWTARADLTAIRAYIARDRPQAARQIAERIRAAVKQLAQHPESGRVSGRPGIRELVIADTRYLVLYALEDQRTVILSVVHGRQDR